MTDNEPPPEDDLTQAVSDLVDFITRAVYGVIAFFVTALTLQVGFGMSFDHAAEPGILNGAIAYYTHEASGRIIKAMWCIANRKQYKNKEKVEVVE